MSKITKCLILIMFFAVFLNKWLVAEDFCNLDNFYSKLDDKFLANCVLTDLELIEIDFRGVNLKDANLSGSNLSGSNFESANLENANLANTQLQSVNVSNAILKNTNLLGSVADGIYGRVSECPPISLLPSNKWLCSQKTNNYLVGPLANLTNANLSGANFDGFDMSKVDISSSYLHGVSGRLDVCPTQENLPDSWMCSKKTNHYLIGPKVNLKKAELANSDLSFASLNQATLMDAILIGANLYKADLSFTNLKFSFLTGSRLHFTNLQSANLYTADLTRADIYRIKGPVSHCPHYLPESWVCSEKTNKFIIGPYSDLKFADLRGASLYSLDLTGTWFEGADLSEANLSKANLSFVSGQLANCPMFISSPWKCSNETNNYIIGPRVDLREAVLTNLDLKNIDLESSDLRKTNFSYSDVDGLNLEGANVEGACFEGVSNLSNIIGEYIGQPDFESCNSEQEESFVCGDLDDNQTLNIIDIMLLTSFILTGLNENNFCVSRFDLNEDSRTNILDIILLQNYIFLFSSKSFCTCR